MTNNNNTRSAFDLLQQEADDAKVKRYIGYVDTYSCRDEDPLLDHRYAYTFWLKGYTGGPFMGPVPVGGKRLQFSYAYTGAGRANKVIGYPALWHRSHYGMTADMFEHSELNYMSPPDNVRDYKYKFSVLCFAFEKYIGPFLSRVNNQQMYNDYMKMTTLGKMAVEQVNRDIMAVIYAQLDMFMNEFFGFDFRTTQMLDFDELMDYIKDIVLKGPGIMLYPRKIHLIKGLKKNSIPQPPPIEGEESEEAEDAFYGGADEDDEFDNDPDQTKTLVLKRMGTEVRPKVNTDGFIPLSAPSKDVIEWRPPGHPESKFVIVSYKESHVKFPMPDLSDITPDEWLQFAIMRFIKRAFVRDKHYFVLPETVSDEIRRLNASHEDEKRRLFPVKLVESNAPRIIDRLVSVGTLVREEYKGVKRIYWQDAWDEQELIVSEVTKLVNEPMFIPRPVETTQSVIARFMEPGKVLTQQQIQAVHTAVTSRISIVAGPGGSGKTVVMDVIQKMLRMMYPRMVFLFVSFKNGIVHNMRTKIGDGTPLNAEPVVNENEFRTLDKLIWSGFHRGDLLAPVVVFMEEAGQASGAHMAGLFKAVDFKKVKNFIMIGDANQRSPISAGTPFRSILRAIEKHGFATRLTHVHRTGAVALRKRQDAILQYDSPAVFADTDDESFRMHVDIPASSNRMSSWIMGEYAQKLYAELSEMTETKKIAYQEQMGICPYNDYCELGNVVAAELFFGGPDYLRIIPQLCSGAFGGSKKKFIHFYAVGMRVVFNKTKKTRENGDPNGRIILLYSRGQVGVITGIMDVDKNTQRVVADLQNTLGELEKPHARRFRVVTGGEEVKIEDFNEMYSVRRVISPGSFITGDRSQGDEYDHVVACLPWGNNLATNDVLYTICSRPKKSLCMVGSKTHIERMIMTPPPRKNWRLDDPDVIQYIPPAIQKTLPAAPAILMLEAPETPIEPTQPEDEFGDATFSDEFLDTLDVVENAHKKIKLE